MRKIFFLFLLVSALPLYTSGQGNYDHKIIAILPFRAMFAEYRNLTDSSREAFSLLEIKYGMQLQEELYKTITRDTNRLLVEVQPWQMTDSLLKSRGVDFLKVPYLDLSAISKLLKVDACVVTTMTRTLPVGRSRSSGIGGSPIAAAVSAIAMASASEAGANLLTKNNKIFFFQLVDGKSGDAVWSLTDEVTPNQLLLSKGKLVISPDLFKRFRKRFLYCD
ncbi:hypothetical protein ACTJJ0_16720 [Chitinophaga sp. 22321]|uniref:Uncharacterized protein n=1 Tax=Chitinophaga hostae TaxID=2831022 RepID=A0ABS5J5P8_9BACT|nr:hypothetical protein [Chitinophaga hostae]MBS0029787.1 hypothetical protein [Chitinophaga hostae]